jgi:hypothetical protein
MLIWVNPGFLVLVGALLRNEGSADQSQHLYVLLCIRCCANLCVAYPIYLDLAQAFLAMTLQRNAISSAEAATLLEHVRQSGAHHATLNEAFISKAQPNADLANEAPERAAAHDIAQMFEDLSMFEEFTTNENITGDWESGTVSDVRGNRGETTDDN